ncbi:MAG: hypothetical protein ABSF69_12925 [Polyangiaceae bacterium]
MIHDVRWAFAYLIVFGGPPVARERHKIEATLAVAGMHWRGSRSALLVRVTSR